MKAYLIPLSCFLLSFFYTDVSLFLFFWSHVSLTINFSFFLSGYIFKSFLILWLFSWSVDEQNTHVVLILFLAPFLSSHISWPGENHLLFASQTHLPVDLSDFSSLQIRPSRCLLSCGLLGQLAFSLQIGRLFLGAAC